MKTVAIVNQKGGCGKTTSAVTLASILASRGERVLLVDLDPQAHCALALAIPEDRIEASIADALLAPEPEAFPIDSIVWQASRHMDVAPATTRLAGLEAARGGLAELHDRDLRLARLLTGVRERYDWCFIDCPPSIGLLTFNALRAASQVMIPIEAGYFALRGAEKQIATLRALARRTGQNARHHVFATMHDPGRSDSVDVVQAIGTRFGDCLVPVTIRFDPALKEATSLGVSIIEHAPDTIGAQDYSLLADWLAEHAEEMRTDFADIVVRSVVPGGPAQQPPMAEVGAAVADARPLSRAAELVERSRRLLERTQSMSERELDQRTQAVIESVEAIHGLGERPAALASAGLSTGTHRALAYGPRQTHQGMLFLFPAGPEATVSVACALSGWSDSAHRMRFNPAIGVHEVCIPFPVGRHAYRIVVNGQWMTDPHNPRTQPNPYGQLDSVIEVAGVGG